MGVITLNRETDGTIPDQTFGEITFEDAGVGVVDFKIDLFGDFNNTDIHKFGFQSSYFGDLTIDPTSIGAADLIVYQNGKVPGLNLNWNWLVSFDNGEPALDPVEFSLIGDTTFSSQSLLEGILLDFNGVPVSTALHAQRTSTPAGSETFTGVTSTDSLPEPSTVFAFAIIGMIALFKRSKKSKLCVI
jgi:hypothetical protein